MLKTRYLHSPISADLKEKMVFVGGPRQVGKTTMAQSIGRDNHKNSAYLNWDNREDRKKIISGALPAEADLVIFDELHKFKRWKNYIKGEYDKNKDRLAILVTGSARLDLYRRGGDSLLGRYHYYRLHPFSVAEAIGAKNEITPFSGLKFPSDSAAIGAFSGLWEYGGFPEPFLRKDQVTLRRFHNEYFDRLIRQDIRDIERVRDLSALEILAELLPGKVGSLLSLNSLREDLGVAHKTAGLWMDIFENFYFHFRIRPYYAKAVKSLRKEPKMYLWDWSLVADEAGRFENIVASHLLKFTHYLYDVFGHRAELYFLRDIEGREADFLVTVDEKPWLAVETKLKETKISKPLKYFAAKLKIPFVYQVIKTGDAGDFIKDGVRVIGAGRFLSGLV